MLCIEKQENSAHSCIYSIYELIPKYAQHTFKNPFYLQYKTKQERFLRKAQDILRLTCNKNVTS